MIQFEIKPEELQKEVTASYGSSSFTLEPGTYTLRVNEFSPTVERNGIVSGTIIFGDVESGTSFKVPVTYRVQEDKDGWRVKQTKSLIIRLCQVTGTNDWQKLVGKQFEADVDIRVSKGNSGQKDADGLDIKREFINNDFKKGPLNEVIREVPKQQEFSATEFTFNSSNYEC